MTTMHTDTQKVEYEAEMILDLPQGSYVVMVQDPDGTVEYLGVGDRSAHDCEVSQIIASDFDERMWLAFNDDNTDVMYPAQYLIFHHSGDRKTPVLIAYNA